MPLSSFRQGWMNPRFRNKSRSSHINCFASYWSQSIDFEWSPLFCRAMDRGIRVFKASIRSRKSAVFASVGLKKGECFCIFYAHLWITVGLVAWAGSLHHIDNEQRRMASFTMEPPLFCNIMLLEARIYCSIKSLHIIWYLTNFNHHHHHCCFETKCFSQPFSRVLWQSL